jgi:hypothetical protein
LKDQIIRLNGYRSKKNFPYLRAGLEKLDSDLSGVLL